MKKISLIVLSAILFVSAFFAGSATPVTAKEPKILEFDTMVGIPAALVRDASLTPLRGITGGGLPWTLTSAHGELKASGQLELEVQGLVLAAGTNAGSNPVGVFRAIVSCVTSNGSFQNILTDPFPATTGPAISGGGNASVETMVTLPQPCIAPIVFITNNNGAWFAATGY